MFWTKHKRDDRSEPKHARAALAQRVRSSGYELDDIGLGGHDRGGGSHGGGGLQRYLPIFDDLSKGTIVEQWMPKDKRKFNKILRNIYTRDSICGPAIDFYKELPWSPYTLVGVEDKVRQLYQDALDNIELLSWLPEASAEYLILGKLCCHFLMNESKGIWEDVIIHNPDYLTVTPIPTINADPKVDLRPTSEMRRFILSNDPRDVSVRDQMLKSGAISEQMISMIIGGQRIPLDPANTVYLPRKGFPYDWQGSSIYLRILNFLSLEYSLLNASISGARRKAGPILHVKMGTEEWEPDLGELEEIRSLFMEAEEDPVGPVIATRNDVEAGYVGGSAELWKFSEEWEWLSQAKMRALGISETFLSGEATYNCLTGDALIPTEQGLLRIDEIADTAKGSQQDIDLIVGSRYKNEKAIKWLSNGKAPTTCITTDCGHSITATPKHPPLVLRDYTLDWLPLSELSIGDIVCAPTGRKTVRTEPLTLNLTWLDQGRGGALRSDLKKPEFMTPELAVVLAGITAEGSVGSTGNETKTVFYNSDPLLLDQYVTCFEKSFGVRPEVNELPMGMLATKPSFAAVVSSKQIVEWLRVLDLYLGTRKDTNGISPSYFKRLGKAIRHADEESQLAYLGMYLACDGSTKGDWCILYLSKSDQLLTELQALLSAHGHFSAKDGMCLSLDSDESWALWQKITPWVSCKHKKIEYNRAYARRNLCIDRTPFDQFLKSRYISSGRHGTWFRNDQGEEINVQGWYKDAPRTESLLQDNYTNGKYQRFLENLKRISVDFHSQLIQLFELNYRFMEVVSIEDKGEQEVYDISMEPGVEPAFIANGLIVHNTMEAVMSIFLERIRAFRDFFTNKLIIQNILAPLAINHEMYKIPPVHLAHRIRVASNRDYRNLILPKLVWRKQLKPQGDDSFLDILDRLEEKGLPVTMRTWASAGGFDLDSEIQQTDADLKLRKKLAKYQQLSQNISGEGGEGEGFNEGFDDFGGGEEEVVVEEPAGEGEEIPGASFNPNALQRRTRVGTSIIDNYTKLPLWKKEDFLGLSLHDARSAFISIITQGTTNQRMAEVLVHELKTRKWDPHQRELFLYTVARAGFLSQIKLTTSTHKRIVQELRQLGNRGIRELIYFSRLTDGESQGYHSQNSTHTAIDASCSPTLLSGTL